VTATDPRTVGVEEELLLVDAATGRLAPAAVELIAGSGSVEDGTHVLSAEFKQEQIEIATRPFRDLADLSTDLLDRHDHLAAAADRLGLLACASGTSPCTGSPTAMPGGRFARIGEEFGIVATDQLTCGMHVHVAVRSPDEGIAVLDRIRVWLAPLVALTANSPYWQGGDSGYASYRTVVLSALPPSGPAPVWGDLASYRRTFDQVLSTGAAFDAAMIYFDARLSAKYPTVEIRVADVSRDHELTVAIAALCRGLVETAARDARAGRRPADLATPVLRSASWRAARHGMTDTLFDPSSLQLRPAWDVVDGMVHRLRDVLDQHGDLDRVLVALEGVRRCGTGAERQRAVRGTDGSAEQALRSCAVRNQLSGPVRAPDLGLVPQRTGSS
jgi:carboxylate-amine ligase